MAVTVILHSCLIATTCNPCLHIVAENLTQTKKGPKNSFTFRIDFDKIEQGGGRDFEIQSISCNSVTAA